MSITRHNGQKELLQSIISLYDGFMKQLVSIENITIKRGSGFNIVHKNRWLPEDCGYCHKPQDTTLQWKATI
jgi:hypothetical protein